MASRAEIAAMMAVMEAAFDPVFGEAWNTQQLASALLVPGTRHAIIDAAGVIGPPIPAVPTAGFYLTRQLLDEEELLLIAVHPDMRRCGLAGKLLRHLFAAASERGTARMFLEMRTDNPARHLYARTGFDEVGIRKAYYRGADGLVRDAVTMAAVLPTAIC